MPKDTKLVRYVAEIPVQEVIIYFLNLKLHSNASFLVAPEQLPHGEDAMTSDFKFGDPEHHLQGSTRIITGICRSVVHCPMRKQQYVTSNTNR